MGRQGRQGRTAWPRAGPLHLSSLLVEDFKDSGLLELTPPVRVEALRHTESNDWLRPYDVSPIDGRFLIVKPAPVLSNNRVTVSVVLNWFEELAAAVPAAAGR